jgi:transposase-like protein
MNSFTPTCPTCRHSHRQTKAGLAVNGNQRFQCQDCKRYYVKENRRHRYPAELRQRAVELYLSGRPCRRIARELQLNHQTVMNWIAEAGVKRTFPSVRAVITPP